MITMKTTLLLHCREAARHCAAQPRPSFVLRTLSFVLALAMVTVSAGAETVQIASAADWASFANRVNAGETSLGATMTADVALSQDSPRVGSANAIWQGEFNGAGHTLTVNWNFTGTEYAAPFAVVKACKIHDLHVAGSITSNAKFAAGLVGYVPAGGSSEYATIERCRVSAALTFAMMVFSAPWNSVMVVLSMLPRGTFCVLSFPPPWMRK